MFGVLALGIWCEGKGRHERQWRSVILTVMKLVVKLVMKKSRSTNNEGIGETGRMNLIKAWRLIKGKREVGALEDSG